MITNLLVSLAMILGTSITGPVADAFVHPLSEDKTTVVIKAPKSAWNIRPLVRDISSNMGPGLNFVYYPGARCRDYPGAVCVRVRIYKFNDLTRAGMWVPRSPNGDWHSLHVLHFNGDYGWWPRREKRSIACHEMLHVLGFTHHREKGCVNTGWVTPSPSTAEYEVLKDHYSKD